MLPRIAPLLRACLVFATVALGAAPIKVTLVSDDPAALRSLSAELSASGAIVTEAAQPRDLVAKTHEKDEVVLLYRRDYVPYEVIDRAALADLSHRGIGFVSVGGAIAGPSASWGKDTFGAGWTQDSRRFRSLMMLNLRTDAHPLSKDASAFDVTDDTVFELDLNEKIDVMASSFTSKVTSTRKKISEVADKASVFDIQPQAWVFANDHVRSAVFLQRDAVTLAHASYRTFIKRGIAWAARRENVDELCTSKDLADLRYPAGGPSRPEKAIAAFQMQPGFKASVVAHEPLIHKPIAVQWDERGRMWVAETPEYPNGRRPLSAEAWREGGVLVPGSYDRPAQDKISILIDSKGDGVVDKKVVFHEGLELITGFCFYRDGVIVVAQDKIVWLRDTDGDGKADKEVVLFGGFRPGDTHFVANHFIVAPDGWIYASNGGGAVATRGTTDEVMARITSGTFRFKPDGSAIEQVASQGGNSFGNEVTSTMELFHGKATNGNPIQHVVLPEAILAKAPGTTAKAFASVNPGRPVARKDMPDRAPLMQIDQVGHYSSACGAMVYEGGAWPKEYDGTVFMSEPILDIIHHEKMTLNGPAYEGSLLLEDKEWLRSMDHWFCPVDMSVGPDGAMYVLDFYTPVVAHNDTRGPLHSKSGASVRPDREHYFGRVYRIQHDAAPKFAIPDLSAADVAGLLAAFSHPSKTVRFNALRVLMERDAGLQASAVGPLATLVRSDARPEARILALWALQRLDRLEDGLLRHLCADADVSVRKNAFLAAESSHAKLPAEVYGKALVDPDARVRLAALRAMGAAPLDAASGILLLGAQSGFSDEWSKAAASAAAAANPGTILQAMMATEGSASSQFARGLAASLAASSDEVARLAILKSAAAAKNLEVAKVVLRELALSKSPAPADHAAGLSALAAVLNVKELAASAAPLAANWVKGDELRAELAAVASSLLPQLADTGLPADVRVQSAQSLVGLRRYDTAIVPAVGALIAKGADESAALAAVEALAATGEDAAGKALLAGFIRTDGAVRKAAYAGLMTRPDWAGLMLGALEEKALSPMQLSTLQSSQLLRHPDEAIAKRSVAVFAKLNVGTSPAKDDLINKLRPEVEKPGDIAKGKELFAAVCSTCHRLGDVGYDFGPNLAGIGSHPAAELLVHIVDPSRMVDDEHRTWNIKLKDGTLYSALIASENTAVLKLKQPAGIVIEVKVADIASRQRVATSLMPEGFEALGPEGLRDLIAYIRSTAASGVATVVGRFHLLDLSAVANADSRGGLYASKSAKGDNLPFVSFGQVNANGVPFVVLDPAAMKGGNNILVLKGGPGKVYSQSFVDRAEIPVGLAASRIHMLGAVGGWGGHPGLAMTVDIVFLSGRKQTVSLQGGQHFADYFGDDADIPGSKTVRGLLKRHHVRTLVIPVEGGEIIDKLILTSPGKEIAPTTAAITVEVGGPANPPADKNAPAPKGGKKANDGPSDLLPKDNPKTTHAYDQLFGPRKAGQLRVLFAGAGSSHNFPAFFLGTDAQTAKAAGYDVAATPNLKETLALLPQADLFVFSGNHGQFGTPEFQKAIRDFAVAGKGIVLLHAATWYNWPLTTKYNDEFVCGGSRNHGHSDFTFTVTKPEHPIMKGVPATFVVNDESYNIELTRPEGAEVLGTIPRQTPKEGQSKILPSVWTVKYPGAKVVCIALGHDEKSHDHPAYKQLLLNSLTWVTQK